MDRASITDKRNRLEQYLREQILGPGISGFRFVDTENEGFHSDLTKVAPIENNNEVINIVPAAVYSTGILFPVDQSSTMAVGAVMDTTESSSNNVGSDEDSSEDSSENTDDASETSDGVQDLNQMFPNSVGLSFALENFAELEEFLKFQVEFRYYRKIENSKDFKLNTRYGILCEVPVSSMDSYIKNQNLSDFSIKTCGHNSVVMISTVNQNRISELRARLRFIQKEAAIKCFKEVENVIKLPNLNESNVYISNLKRRIYNIIKTEANADIRKSVFEKSQQLELIESINQHLENLLDIVSNKSYGLWQSELIRRDIEINSITFPKTTSRLSFLYHKDNNIDVKILDTKSKQIVSNSLSDIFKIDLNDDSGYASLGVNLLLSRDSRDDLSRTFVKIQLVNSSTPFVLKEKNTSQYYSPFNENVNSKSFFGVKIRCEEKRIAPISAKNYESESSESYPEDAVTDFIYRQYQDYGIGHGVSVNWYKRNSGTTVETEYIPSTETPEVDTIPRDKSQNLVKNKNGEYEFPKYQLDNKALQFKWLSTLSSTTGDEIKDSLTGFVKSYGDWIDIKRNQPEYSSSFEQIAKQELDKCELDFKRMMSNIDLLFIGENATKNLAAFRIMNTVMFMQLWHSQQSEADMNKIFTSEKFTDFNFEFYRDKANDHIFGSYPASWRPFQLAFILLNLDGILTFKGEFSSNRNEVVDLVWFPTGGGKTEAYLGLIALTIAIRRHIHGSVGGGTAAIMRYTLRLLTMQQFQRATLLIMALELVRRWDIYDLGEEPIYIGLWVGNDSLPNKNEELIKEYKEKLNQELENKVPLNNCPWCKSSIQGEQREDVNSLSVFNRKRVHLKCVNKRCAFSLGIGRNRGLFKGPIPVSLSDEIIYHHPPALLFGTVDKFAQLAHKVSDDARNTTSDSRRLFGRGNWENGKPSGGYQPPDLIIQDELHLLQGPLGSAVGLFEAAIEQLCINKEGVKSKIISSTATTRNTDLQIAALFNRRTNIFPKSGVECDDSFFAYYKRSSKTPLKDDIEYEAKRKYVGILPTGKTQIWMQMRIASIIMSHRAIYESLHSNAQGPLDYKNLDSIGEVMDSYHTLISYFNSLKEVGKTQAQIQSYLLKEHRRVFNRVLRPHNLLECIYAYGPIREAELTGRLSGEEVKNELSKVEQIWRSESRFSRIIDGKLKKGNTPPDFVIATNMISVGIDVSRFNVIMMNSMPRNTAEYIQASSRVARKHKGLVITIHHPFRARDTSHYERFRSFHSKMYSFVEPISITPFTRKSLNRYFSLYISTLLRHKLNFHNRNSAGEIVKLTQNEINGLKITLFRYFIERKELMKVLPETTHQLLKDENINDIEKWIDSSLDYWLNKARVCKDNEELLVFNNEKSSSTHIQKSLYTAIDEYLSPETNEFWRVPMSLRVIEPSAAIKIYSK